MYVTLLGILIVVRLLHLMNAFSLMPVTPSGMLTVLLQPTNKVLVAVSMMALQFSRESYTELPLSTRMDVKPLHI